jgi:hypothetical protein
MEGNSRFDTGGLMGDPILILTGIQLLRPLAAQEIRVTV